MLRCPLCSPQWLEIKAGDDEKTIARKKKLLKSYKSKKRFQEMDIKQKERQDNWQQFLKGKGSKPKKGERASQLFHVLDWGCEMLHCTVACC